MTDRGNELALGKWPGPAEIRKRYLTGRTDILYAEDMTASPRSPEKHKPALTMLFTLSYTQCFLVKYSKFKAIGPMVILEKYN